MTPANEPSTGPLAADVVHRHVRRMRWTAVLFLLTVPAAALAGFLAEPRRSAFVSPSLMTVLALLAALWIGFTANRDANHRLERAKTAFVAHGGERRLLRDHWLVYVVVLLRLEVIILCGVVVAVWGLGPFPAMWVVVLGGVMIGLTWPTVRKTQLLLGRARAMRTDG
jgi:hypothetical protein